MTPDEHQRVINELQVVIDDAMTQRWAHTLAMLGKA